MSNTFDAMRQALSEAADIQRAADMNSEHMAQMLRGRLRHVSAWTLSELKRELRDFNIHTGEWRDSK